MTGNLPAYEVELPPTCDDYCNCTYVWDLPAGANCSQFEPKPDNCSCGCVPDCLEVPGLSKIQDCCELSTSGSQLPQIYQNLLPSFAGF